MLCLYRHIDTMFTPLTKLIVKIRFSGLFIIVLSHAVSSVASETKRVLTEDMERRQTYLQTLGLIVSAELHYLASHWPQCVLIT